MAAPQLTAYSQGQTSVTADRLNTFCQTCTSVAQLRGIIGVSGMEILLRGLATDNDGGAGAFYWDSSATGPDNGTNVIVPTGAASGAWVRLQSYSSASAIQFPTTAALLAAFASPIVLDNGSISITAGRTSETDQGGTIFFYDSADTTSADNGGTIRVDSAGRRWYAIFQEGVNPAIFGAVGDGNISSTSAGTDNTSAFLAAIAVAEANNSWLNVGVGIFRVMSVLQTSIPIVGVSQTTTIIFNGGTGDCLNFSTANYYTELLADISIVGNATSRDNITLLNTTNPGGVPQTSYCVVRNVLSYNAGRYGLLHRMSWGTTYSQCQFFQNGSHGVFADTELGDSGPANGVVFDECHTRHNVGYGLNVQGAAGFYWVGGVIESNIAGGCKIGAVLGGPATRNVYIEKCYLEFNGYTVNNSDVFTIFGPWANVAVKDSWIAYGSDTIGHTNRLYNVSASVDNGNFIEQNNTHNVVGIGTAVRYTGTQFSAPQIGIGTAPAVSVYQNLSLSVADSTLVKLPLNTATFDTNQNFDTVTNYRFTPTVPGYYRVSVIANYFPAVGANGYVTIFKNGTSGEEHRGPGIGGTGISVGLIADDLIFMNGTTDYLEFYVFQASGSTQTYNPTPALCRASMEFARGT